MARIVTTTREISDAEEVALLQAEAARFGIAAGATLPYGSIATVSADPHPLSERPVVIASGLREDGFYEVLAINDAGDFERGVVRGDRLIPYDPTPAEGQ